MSVFESSLLRRGTSGMEVCVDIRVEIEESVSSVVIDPSVIRIERDVSCSPDESGEDI